MPNERERLLTITEAARLIGVHANTLRAWSDQGRVPHVLLPSGYRRFRRAEIEKFLAEMERGKDE